MARYDPPPPPYRTTYGTAPPLQGNSYLPQHYYTETHIPHGERVTVRLIRPDEQVPGSFGYINPYAAADAVALDRFWCALFLGIMVWLALGMFTDGLEILQLLLLGLKAALDRILEELRHAGNFEGS
ncbi:hypothetical protein AX17_002075 [Amanita inopinata Kibby_2008]|nr:hypothetical protein AX17_002075 [Amanita inopinata Kibby_2008]